MQRWQGGGCCYIPVKMQTVVQFNVVGWLYGTFVGMACHEAVFRTNNRPMHTFIIYATLSALCHLDMFQPSKSHLQGLRLIHFQSKVNKMSYQTQNSV